MSENKAKIKGGLNLEPNEIVGYRISPDAWNWTVVVVKRHGKDSKNAGMEYKETLSYPKNLSSAVSWIFNHVSAIEGRKIQDLEEQKTGNCADLKSLEKAFTKARQEALNAVEDLEKRLQAMGIDASTKGLNKLMGSVAEESK